MEGLLPNFTLMARPWNWFVVAFSVLLLLFAIHLSVDFLNTSKDK